MDSGVVVLNIFDVAFPEMFTGTCRLVHPPDKLWSPGHGCQSSLGVISSSEYRKASRPTPCRLRCIRTSFDGACGRAKLTGVTPHVLRHTFASRLAMLGTDLRTIQELGGSRSTKIVDRCSHLKATTTKAPRWTGWPGDRDSGQGFPQARPRVPSRRKLLNNKNVGV